MAKRNHYNLVTTTLYYMRGEDPQMKQRMRSSMMVTPTKNISAVALNNVRMATIQNLIEGTEIEMESVVDFVINGISYLGFMSDSEFQETPTDAQKASLN